MWSALVLLPLFAGGKMLAGRKKSADLYAIIGGTVFRDPGFALRGAEVTLEPEKTVVNGSKLKGQKAVSDARGEFAFRVAPIEGAKYKLTASMPGLQPETRFAETRGGEERIDVTFMLLPASK
jgi:hypothetical protein